jgi:hypothetical protein
VKKPTISGDGVLRVDLLVPMRADVHVLASALALSRDWWDEPARSTLKAVRAAVMAELAYRGENVVTVWADQYAHTTEAMDEFTDRYAAAEAVVRRVFGFPTAEQAATSEQFGDVMAEATAAVGADLVAQARNIFGAVGPEVRARLMALITDPSCATWDDAQSIVLNPDVGLGRTLWQAMIRVDPTCPTSGAPEGLNSSTTPEQRWRGYAPSPMMVLVAIGQAVNEGPTQERDPS